VAKKTPSNASSTSSRKRDMFVLWDARAAGGVGTNDDPSCLTASEDEKEVRDYAAEGHEGACSCYSYVKNAEDVMVDEQWEWDWFPGKGFSGPRAKP